MYKKDVLEHIETFKKVKNCPNCEKYKGVTDEGHRVFLNCDTRCTVFGYDAGKRWFLTVNVISCRFKKKKRQTTLSTQDLMDYK